jgi:hypothetical protein
MLLGCKFIFEDAQAIYLHLDAVAWLNGSNSCRSSSGNEVAGLERHDLRYVAEQVSDGKEPPAGSISSETMGPTGQKVSKPLPRVHWPSDF